MRGAPLCQQLSAILDGSYSILYGPVPNAGLFALEAVAKSEIGNRDACGGADIPVRPPKEIMSCRGGFETRPFDPLQHLSGTGNRNLGDHGGRDACSHIAAFVVANDFAEKWD